MIRVFYRGDYPNYTTIFQHPLGNRQTTDIFHLYTIIKHMIEQDKYLTFMFLLSDHVIKINFDF